MHKHRALVDEVLCQLMKQLTENKSLKSESVQSGWKLLVILLNYFVPSEHLRPYFVKYLNDKRSQNEKLGRRQIDDGIRSRGKSIRLFVRSIVQLCLNHYEQTLKYGGRKNTPSKAEIDVLTAVSTDFVEGSNPTSICCLDRSERRKASNVSPTGWHSIDPVDNTIDGKLRPMVDTRSRYSSIAGDSRLSRYPLRTHQYYERIAAR
jgi:hypothetical protein